MRVVFFGTGDFAVPALRSLHRAGYELASVISQPDRPAGRGRAVGPTPMRAAAEALGLRHVQTPDVNALDLRDVLGGAELGVVAAFGQKLGRPILDALPSGCVNIHASLLPKYRGAAPYQWAILNGEERTGVTIFQLDERWDAGAIWSQRDTVIGETETADELHDRLAVLGGELIVETVPIIAAGRVQPQPQHPAQATRAPKLTKADGFVDWSQPAHRVVRRIHGLWSWPAAACRFCARSGKNERLLLARAQVVETNSRPTDADPPGMFLADRTIQTGRGRVRLREVQPAGGRRMAFTDFANGRNIGAGDRLVTVEG